MVEVTGSLSAKLCALFEPCANRRWSKPLSPAIDHCPAVHAILVMATFDVVDQFVSPRHIQQRTDCTSRPTLREAPWRHRADPTRRLPGFQAYLRRMLHDPSLPFDQTAQRLRPLS
jgi:hypothetical protein